MLSVYWLYDMNNVFCTQWVYVLHLCEGSSTFSAQ